MSQVVICSDIESAIDRIVQSCESKEIVRIVKKESFLVEDAKLAIEKAYLASEVETLLLLAAPTFSPVVQNKLLKIIEEPPPKKTFILVTVSKATVLPTIKSRLPVIVLASADEEEQERIEVERLDLQAVYALAQSHRRSDTTTVRNLVETIAKEVFKSDMYRLDEDTYDLFRDAVKALDKGSPPSFVLTTVLVKLLAKKKR